MTGEGNQDTTNTTIFEVLTSAANWSLWRRGEPHTDRYSFRCHAVKTPYIWISREQRKRSLQRQGSEAACQWGIEIVLAAKTVPTHSRPEMHIFAWKYRVVLLFRKSAILISKAPTKHSIHDRFLACTFTVRVRHMLLQKAPPLPVNSMVTYAVVKGCSSYSEPHISAMVPKPSTGCQSFRVCTLGTSSSLFTKTSTLECGLRSSLFSK